MGLSSYERSFQELSKRHQVYVSSSKMSYDLAKMEISMMVEWQLILPGFVNNFQTKKARNVIKASAARIGGAWAKIGVSGARIGGSWAKIGGYGAKFGGTVAPIEASGIKIGPLRPGLRALGPILGHLGPGSEVLGLRLGLLA